MEPIQETPPIAASVTSLEEKISSPRQLSKEPETPVISSGEAVAIPPSTQSAIYTSITLEHKKITNALLTAMGKGELIETPVPEDLEDAKDIEELEDFLKVESLKRMERNDILYPKRKSAAYEMLFITPRKRAINPNYVRAHVARKYRKLSGGDMDIEFDEEGKTAGRLEKEPGKTELVRLGDNVWFERKLKRRIH